MWRRTWGLPRQRLTARTAVVDTSFGTSQDSNEYIADKCNYIYPNGWHSLYHRKVAIVEKCNFVPDHGRSGVLVLLQALFIAALYLFCSNTVTTSVVIIYLMVMSYKELIHWNDFLP
jgi:hypothetical protein